MPLSPEEIEANLREVKGALGRFGVERLLLFGSAARGEATDASDLDFLVELSPKTFRNYMGLKLFLEARFGRPMDLVTVGSLKPALRGQVAREATRVA